jgi:curli biogenesis system outer membrane secretion channel CsgG
MKITKVGILLIATMLIASFLFSSCSLFGTKEKAQVDKGKEGQWVYSSQKPSPTGEQKRATTYSKRPYAGKEGEEVALAGTETKPIITPYVLGRLKYKIVIAEFQDNTKQGGKRGLGVLVTQQLAQQLEETGAVIVADMEEVKKTVGGGELNSLSAPSTLWKLRILLGVQGVVTGKIQDLLVGTGKQAKTEEALASAKIDVQLLDTDTGNVMRSIKGENPIYSSHAVGELSQDKALSNAVNVALQGVSEGILRGLAGLEWSTSVATVEGDKIYLNAGKSTGLKVGDELEIYNPGRQVKNPTSGVSLGRLPGTLLGKIKINQLFGFDAAEAKVVSGGNITSGDMVRLSR